MLRTGLVLLVAALVLTCGAAPVLAHEVIYNFPLSSDPGWYRTGDWQFGAPGGAGGDPAAAYTGDFVFGNNLSGAYANDIGIYQWLETGPLDCAGVEGTTLTFWRWLGVEDNAYDHAGIWVSGNGGGSWTAVWANSTADIQDSAWQFYSYDISAVADGQTDVRVLWTLGPTDYSVTYSGWNLDDIQIWGHTSEPPLQILAWVPYADATREYPNTVAALAGLGEPYVVTESYATEATTLAAELQGKQVFLVPEPESAQTADLTAAGAAFAAVLQDFAYHGGTVVVCGEHIDVTDHTGFMAATGLMSVAYAGVSFAGGTLTTVLPGEPISESLPGTFTGSNATAGYVLGPESTAVVEEAAGNAVFAYRDYGFGAALMVGFDYYDYDPNAAQVLVNAVRYPRWNREALLYRSAVYTDNSLEALKRLHLRYQLASGAADMTAAFAYPASYWNPIVYDSPATWASTDGAGLVDYIANGGKAALSTWNLTAEPAEMAAAFGVTPVGHFTSNPPVYRWDPADPIFTDPMTVPDLLTWSDAWGGNGDRFSVAAADGVALAGVTPAFAADQALIVRANGGRTIVNGFLWDEQSGDSDLDGVDDVVELIMDEVITLARTPEADFIASWSGTYGPLPVSFTDASLGVAETWLWNFGDGTTSTEQDPIHTYTSVGLFTVSLTVSNAYGQDTETKLNLVLVTAVLSEADFEASVTAGDAPLAVTFTDLSTSTPTEWAWDFGDGGISTEQDPVHTYAAAGTFDVSLTATNAAGSDTEEKLGYITVTSPIAAAFTVANATGTVPLTVTFTDTTTGGPDGWSWDFGDGGTSTDQSPTHTYADPGYYTVTLTAAKGVVTDVVEQVGCVAAGFVDTLPDYWAFHYILACATEDIVQGYFGNEYKPTQEVTRGQMAVYLARALAGGEAAVPEPAVVEPTFSDVLADHWAYRYVEYVADLNVVQGYGGGVYKPDVVVNRGQMAVFIARSVADPVGDAGVPEADPVNPAFPDVTATNDWGWCYKYVQYIASLDPVVVQGYPDGTYKPEANVTRDQMAVYVQRAFALPMYAP